MSKQKDSKTSQTVSTAAKGGIGEARWTGANMLIVLCPNDITMCPKSMGGVDRGNQHRVVDVGFANAAHFKKWHQKA